MGIELDLLRELGTISVTLTELSAVTRVINSELKASEFGQRYNRMVAEISIGYDAVTDNLLPLCELESQAEFEKHFDDRHAAYNACYLNEISKPRNHGEAAYEEYLELQTMKQFKTGYPLLKRTFTRLDQFIDKWINNDAWLAMCVDNLFKRLKQLLNEIADLKKKDAEDAFIIYQAAFGSFRTYLILIRQLNTELKQELAA